MRAGLAGVGADVCFWWNADRPLLGRRIALADVPDAICLSRKESNFGKGAACLLRERKRTTPPSTKLFQWQEQFRDRLMLRHLRKEGDALAVEWKIPCLLAAGG
ncbi:hypothetical protein GCM10008023_18920 [Sphingomonas glacialis]|uniref:Uncharacterized protein n=1 Tax=Sphingomonas glacialis TaxID=658225 RepID=A0ABQ3LIA5_9SPHN|nr:hypothetical protein GCM10008023_18920 [Sphingomonas glacialis]